MELIAEAIRGARVVVRFCGQVRRGDRVLIVTDDTTEDVGKYLFDAARELTEQVNWVRTRGEGMHGNEPSENVAEAMLKVEAIFGATQSSMAHTQARLNASNRGARYLSLPDYSIEQLASPSLTVDFVKWARIAKKFKDALDQGNIVKIETKKGTNLTLVCVGRKANFCPGFCVGSGTLGSPPDIETNVPPLEDKSEGVLIVDGSIPCREIGILKHDVRVKIKDGSIEEIDESTEQGKKLRNILDALNDRKTLVLAEFGIGLNPKAQLCGRMLEDEGCLGTVHFGFGSNSTIGGVNRVNFHLDFVIRYPTVEIDGTRFIEEGTLLIS